MASFCWMISPTFPWILFGISSTYCSLVIALRLFSSNLVRQFCSSEPLKYFRICSHSGGLSQSPRFGFIFPERICSAVDFPIPLVPTSPSTCPGLGVGNLCNLKVLFPYLWVVFLSMFLGRLIILMAWKGHLFTQSPQPMQRISEISTNADCGVTSMQSFSVLLTGQAFLHSCLHFLGLHFYLFTMAILSFYSYIHSTS